MINLGGFLVLLPSFVLCAACVSSPSTKAAPSRIEPIEVGAFTVTNERNRLTQQLSPAAATFDEPRNGMLQFACADQYLDIRLGVSGPVSVAANQLTVRVAFDTAPPGEPSIWLVQRQDVYVLAYLRPDLAPTFAKLALGSSEARVEVNNAVNSSVEVYQFSLNGLASASLRLPCWSPS